LATCVTTGPVSGEHRVRHHTDEEAEMSISDVMIHIQESLSGAARAALATRLRGVDGVIAPRFNPGTEHLLLVAFNPAKTRPGELLAVVREAGRGAKLVGV
jgi:hypothetical protein